MNNQKTPTLNIKDLALLKSNPIEYYKSYSHKPHLADLPHDLRSTNPEELQERIDEINTRIEKEEKKIRGWEKFLKDSENDIKRYKQEIKEDEKQIKEKTKQKDQFVSITNDSAKRIGEDLEKLEKGLYYENGKKLSRSKLEEKWSTPDKYANNSLESLKILEDGLDNMNYHYKNLNNHLERFNKFQGKSEAINLEGSFSDLSEAGKKVDKELEKVHGGYHVSFLGEADDIMNPFGEWDSTVRYKIYGANDCNEEIFKLNKHKNGREELIDSLERTLVGSKENMEDSKTRLKDYKDQLKKTEAKKKEAEKLHG